MIARGVGNGCQPSFLAAASKMIADLIGGQRRQRKFAAARRLEHIAADDLLALQVAGLARYADLVFGEVVVGLKLGVA